MGAFKIIVAADAFQGRVTVALIMAGAVAKKLLGRFDVDVLAYTTAIGKVKSDKQVYVQRKFARTGIKRLRGVPTWLVQKEWKRP